MILPFLVGLVPFIQAPDWQPFTLTAGSQKAEGEFARIKVPESRKKGSKGTVELAFVRLKSTAEKPGAPIVYLDGGPGGSGINMGTIPEYFAVVQKLRESGDVILLDQRGVGRTKPSLLMFGGAPLGNDFYLSKENFMKPFIERFKAGAKYFKEKEIDITAYNTEESADDVNDLRKALGVPKISILGFSYGTHLGLSVIRRHGANLDRAILIGTEGPDHTVKLPMEGDRQIERLAVLVSKDPAWNKMVPNFKALVARVFKKAETEPFVVTFENRTLRVGKYGLQHLVMRDLGDTNDHPVFPLLFYTLDKGDTTLLARFAQRRYQQYMMGINIMTLVMDYMSGVSPARQKQVDEEAKTALLGDAMNLFSDDLGSGLGIPLLGDDFRAPIKTDVPTLFISGVLDWNTQPHQADEVRKTFKNSEHIVVGNAGHESTMIHPQIIEQMVKFLKGGSTKGFTLNLDPPKFVPPPQ